MNKTDRIRKIALVANLPLQTVQAYYKREQIPKALVNRIRAAEGMIR